jgi:hypothetical protein
LGSDPFTYTGHSEGSQSILGAPWCVSAYDPKYKPMTLSTELLQHRCVCAHEYTN